MEDALAYTGGLITLVVALGAQFSPIFIYPEADTGELLKGLSSSALYYASALAGASTTGLGLLFTVIGMSRGSDEQLDERLYARVGRLALFLVLMLVGSVLLLLILCVPLAEYSQIPELWMQGTFYFLTALVSILTALAVTIILLLFTAVRQVLLELTPLKSMWGHTNRTGEEQAASD